MQIRQISIFLENKPGQLSQICRDLADAGINIATLSLADTSDFGIVRMIVDDHDIPFQPFLYDACRKTISAVSGIKEMEDNALLNTSDSDYIPDAMYAITDEGREISYLERQDELVNLKINVVE